MIGLYRDPTGERVFEKYGGKSSSKSNNIPVAVVSVAGDSVDSLRRRVAELEDMLLMNVCPHENSSISYPSIATIVSA